MLDGQTDLDRDQRHIESASICMACKGQG